MSEPTICPECEYTVLFDVELANDGGPAKQCGRCAAIVPIKPKRTAKPKAKAKAKAKPKRKTSPKRRASTRARAGTSRRR